MQAPARMHILVLNYDDSIINLYRRYELIRDYILETARRPGPGTGEAGRVQPCWEPRAVLSRSLVAGGGRRLSGGERDRVEWRRQQRGRGAWRSCVCVELLSRMLISRSDHCRGRRVCRGVERGGEAAAVVCV